MKRDFPNYGSEIIKIVIFFILVHYSVLRMHYSQIVNRVVDEER